MIIRTIRPTATTTTGMVTAGAMIAAKFSEFGETSGEVGKIPLDRGSPKEFGSGNTNVGGTEVGEGV